MKVQSSKGHGDGGMAMQAMTTISGSITALVTPFRGGKVDFEALGRLVDRQIAAGTDWLAVCGTTGEAPTLTEDEQEQILTSVLSHSKGRCPVMMGTGTYDTA